MDSQPDRPTHFFREHLPLQRIDGVRSGKNTSVESQLCAKCESIRDWIRANLNALVKPGTSAVSPPRFPHHVSGKALEDSYKSGCHLCTLLWVHLTEDPTGERQTPAPVPTDPQDLVHARERDQLEKYSGITRRMGTVTLQLQQPSAKIKDAGTNISGELLAILSVVGLPGTQPGDGLHLNAGPWVVDKSWPISTDSATVLDCARVWVDNCAASHDRCKRKSGSSLPTRLLQVTPSRDHMVRLVETNTIPPSQDREYATLSYCWGGSTKLKLTLDSYHSFTTVGITKSELPETIYDALVVAVSMNIAWLWVDSLCIIQDSPEDWVTQAASMTEVYQNCRLCIAARGGQKSSDGMFCHRDPLRFVPCQMYETDEGMPVSILSPYLSSALRYGIDWPLDTRGWVVQERILPPRTIRFGAYMSFECREQNVDEFLLEQEYELTDRWTQKLFDMIDGSPKPTPDSIAHLTLAPEPSFDYRLRDIYETWREIVGVYSVTGLTSRSDRLAAISGVIGLISRATSLRNQAGLWEQFLVEELLWRTSDEDPSPTGLGPTWSWVALECEVWYCPHLSNYWDPYGPYQTLCRGLGFCPNEELRQHNTETACDNPIRLAYFSLPAQLMSSGTQGPGTEFRLGTPVELPNALIECTLDRPTTESDWAQLLLVPLVLLSTLGVYRMYGLVVRPSAQHRGTFERAGIFEWQFNDGESRWLVDKYISRAEYTPMILT
ncbi:hypothetical protein OQA88_2470 [Cercophora sp. LCS_1]